MTLRVLHVEDEKWFHQIVASAIGAQDVHWARTLGEAQKLFNQHSFDVILLDRHLGEEDSFPAIPLLLDSQPQATLIVLSSSADSSSILQALECGAVDYILKTPQIAAELSLRIAVARKAHLSRQLIESTRDRYAQNSRIIGVSEHVRHLREKVHQVAQTDASVLITGETGTGKEVVASEIHRLRGGGTRPFVVLNCGAIPESLFESELFGHVKGAFTGATQNKNGLLMTADGGDLFLDEVAEMPIQQQVKLLRFLQEGRFTPVGSTREIYSKVRVMAATHQNLEKAIREGRFREDLFYRLDVFRIETRPLRDRPEDIEPLVNHWLSRGTTSPRKIMPEAIALLERQEWRGNVRELSAVIQRALIEAGGDDIRASHIQIQNIGASRGSPMLPRSKREVSARGYQSFIKTAQGSYLSAALALYGGDTAEVAKALQLSRATIYNQLKRLKHYSQSSPRKSERT